MRMGKKKLLQFTAIVMCLICLTGCGAGPALPEDTDISVNAQDIPSAGSEGHQQPDGSGTGSGTTGDSAELPEGYVYDYQVSLEPIPQEIADLGGMCVGTMHAFPSRIMVGLMKQRMEEDPELKAEVEKRVEEVKQSLSEEIGGEFEVEIMRIADNKWDWTFYCTEKETGYEFNMKYFNNEFSDISSSKNLIFISDYFKKIEAEQYEKDIRDIVFKIYENCCLSVWCQEGVNEKKDISLYMAFFIDNKVDYEKEQYKIIQLWESLQKYDDERDYSICIEYYPIQYEDMIRQRCAEGIWWDIYKYSDDEIKQFIQGKELYDVFSYLELIDQENSINMDTLLNEFINKTYDETTVWDYWIKGGN